MRDSASSDIEAGVIDVLKSVSRRPIEPTSASDLVTDLGFDSLQVLEVIAIVAASTITNYAGTITNPRLEDTFRRHAWQG